MFSRDSTKHEASSGLSAASFGVRDFVYIIRSVVGISFVYISTRYASISTRNDARHETTFDVDGRFSYFVSGKFLFIDFEKKERASFTLFYSTRLRLYESRIFVEFLLDTRLSSKREILFSRIKIPRY